MSGSSKSDSLKANLLTFITFMRAACVYFARQKLYRKAKRKNTILLKSLTKYLFITLNHELTAILS